MFFTIGKRAPALGLALLVLSACGVPEPPASLPELAKRAAEGDAKAAQGLVALLGGATGTDQRAEAYRALLEAGAKTAGQAIAAAARDADPIRREHALALAGNLKLDGAFDLARDALADPAFPRAHAAVWVLGELADPRALPLLADALAKGQPPLASREAARALSRFGAPAAAPILERLPAMRGEARSSALRILGELKAPEVKPALVRALDDAETRRDALWALGTLGRVGPPVDLKPYLADTDWRCRVEACRSLSLLHDVSAAPALDRMRRGDAVVEVREWAARALGILTERHEQYQTLAGAWKNPDELYR